MSLFDREISREMLDELTAFGLNPPESDTGRDPARLSTMRSAHTIAPGQVVRLADGVQMPFIEVPLGTPICRPVHPDKGASALQRASRNNLRKHFVQHKQAQGFTVVRVPAEADLGAVERSLLCIGSKLHHEKRAAHMRTELELFYRSEATEALIRLVSSRGSPQSTGTRTGSLSRVPRGSAGSAHIGGIARDNR